MILLTYRCQWIRTIACPHEGPGIRTPRRLTASKNGGDFRAHRGALLPVATAHGAPVDVAHGAGGSFCRLRRAIRWPCLGGPFSGAGYRVPLASGYAAGGHGVRCLQSPMHMGGLFTDSAWTIAVRVAIYDAPSFAPAVAHLSPDRGRVPCSCCCLASLVTFSGRQSPPLSCHRWPGSCARLAPRNALALQAAADSSLHPLSYSRFERACLVCFRGVSLSTQTAYGRMAGVARVVGKEK